jgi:hypothetical protein
MKSFRNVFTGLLGAAAILAALPAPTLADPLKLEFPSLGAEAQTEAITVQDGQLGVPDDPDHLGVYELDGNMLVVGHVDWAGERRLFADVRLFQPGEPIWLSDGRTYHVAWTKTLPLDADETEWAAAFAPADDVLTLVTCSGPFSISRREYLERIVIRAVRDD